MRFANIDLNANIWVFATLAAFFIMAFMFGEAKLKRITLAVLVGIFAADQLAQYAMTQLHSLINVADIGTWKFVIFGITALPLTLGKSVSVGGHFSIRSFVLAFLASVTVIAYGVSFLAASTQSQLSTEYNLVAIAANNQLAWLSGLLGWLIVLQVWKKKSKLDEGNGKGKKKKRR